MEERDARDEARSQQHETQVSRSAPQPATLPSMHAPHLATQHEQRHHNYSSYPHPAPTHYAPSPAQHNNHFYDQRDTHHVPSQQPAQQYDYRQTATPSVSLPPIQHFDAPTAVPAPPSTSSNMSGQSTGPSPAPHHPPLPQHPYAHTNGDAQHYQPQHYGQMPPIYQYPGQYHQPYGNGMHPPPPSAMMPSNAPNGQIRYLPANAQLDPRQMSGGRHKKEIKRRTKTGCLTCRKRRIKCDEEHPHCRNCAKSKRECLGYDPVFKSQPAPIHLQPAPEQPGRRLKAEPGYAAYQYPVGAEYMQQPSPMQAPPSNGNHVEHSAAPLANGDHNRGPMHATPVDAQKGMPSVPRT